MGKRFFKRHGKDKGGSHEFMPASTDSFNETVMVDFNGDIAHFSEKGMVSYNFAEITPKDLALNARYQDWDDIALWYTDAEMKELRKHDESDEDSSMGYTSGLSTDDVMAAIKANDGKKVAPKEIKKAKLEKELAVAKKRVEQIDARLKTYKD